MFVCNLSVCVGSPAGKFTQELLSISSQVYSLSLALLCDILDRHQSDPLLGLVPIGLGCSEEGS